MATNSILPFCETDTGSNLLTDLEYSGDAQRTIGNQPGVAKSKLVNKALRGSTLVASAIAKFVADNQSANITDAVTQANLAAYLDSAMRIRTAANLASISASVATNALTVTINPQVIQFRKSTLTNGTPDTIELASAASMTVSSGSTLGTVNGVAARLAILAINNAGTIEAAIVNLAGGVNLDESTLISTTAEGGAGGADSANIVYSTTARTNVPFRVMGYIDITEATAGTWATAPTLVQPAGGQSLGAMGTYGFGQSQRSVLGSRAIGTTYYNTTGKPIEVSIALVSTIGANPQLTITSPTAGSVTISGTGSAAGGINLGVSATIPPGHSYSASVSAGTGTLLEWVELY